LFSNTKISKMGGVMWKGYKKEESFGEFLTGLALKEGKFKVGGIIIYRPVCCKKLGRTFKLYWLLSI